MADIANFSKVLGVAEKDDIKFEYDVSDLDYSFLKTCVDIPHLKSLLRVLRSGKEGYYPDLERSFEKKIAELQGDANYSTYFNRKVSYELVSMLKAEFDDWEKAIKTSDDRLLKTKTTNQIKRRPPVRVFKNEDCITYMEDESNQSDADTLWNESSAELDAEEERLFLAEAERIKGNECLRVGETREAADFYTRSLNLVERANLYTNRALTYIKLGDWKSAEADATRALEFSDERLYFKALQRRGIARFHMKRNEEAKADLQASLDLDPLNQKTKFYMEKSQAKQALPRVTGLIALGDDTKITEIMEVAEEENMLKGKRLVVEDVDTEDDDDEEMGETQRGESQFTEEIRGVASKATRLKVVDADSDDEDE
ncbi:hypothetical protein BC829DRAFT_378317 [Chytridium lagenaria]|nr:hypothetical protein BC829DRAFT_378317 [Chytridium lagenaria]